MRGLEEIKSRNAAATDTAVLRTKLEHIYARAAYAKLGLANGSVRKALQEICETCVEGLEGDVYG